MDPPCPLSASIALVALLPPKLYSFQAFFELTAQHELLYGSVVGCWRAVHANEDMTAYIGSFASVVLKVIVQDVGDANHVVYAMQSGQDVLSHAIVAKDSALDFVLQYKQMVTGTPTKAQHPQ